MGNLEDMLEVKRRLYHGRCYEKEFGLHALISLPTEQLYKLRLNDIGPDTMKILLAHLDSKNGK